MDVRIPHRERLEMEIREVFLNAVFGRPPDCTDNLVEANVCHGMSLVIHAQANQIAVALADDWIRSIVYTETILQAAAPDWEHFRRWLWDACYEEVRQVVASICKTMGIGVPWPEPVQGDAGRKHFPGREPLETIDDVFSALTAGAGSAHVIFGATKTGKSSLALRIALDAVAAGKTVLFASMEATTDALVRQAVVMGGLPRIPDALKLSGLSGNNIGSVLKEIEGLARGREVLFLDLNFSKLGDQPKRLAMKTQSEVFVCQQASWTVSQDPLTALPPDLLKLSDGAYMPERPGAPFRVLKHRSGRAGSRIMPSQTQKAALVGSKPASTYSDVAVQSEEDLTNGILAVIQRGGRVMREIRLNPVTYALVLKTGAPKNPQQATIGGQGPSVTIVTDHNIPNGMARLVWV